jgi:hypothetical protein
MVKVLVVCITLFIMNTVCYGQVSATIDEVGQENMVSDSTIPKFITKLRKCCIEKDTTTLFAMLSPRIAGSGLNYGGGRLRSGMYEDDDIKIFKSHFEMYLPEKSVFWDVMLDYLTLSPVVTDSRDGKFISFTTHPLNPYVFDSLSQYFFKDKKILENEIWFSLDTLQVLYNSKDLFSSTGIHINTEYIIPFDSIGEKIVSKVSEPNMIRKEWVFVQCPNANISGWLHNPRLYNDSNMFGKIDFTFRKEKDDWTLYFYSF